MSNTTPALFREAVLECGDAIEHQLARQRIDAVDHEIAVPLELEALLGLGLGHARLKIGLHHFGAFGFRASMKSLPPASGCGSVNRRSYRRTSACTAVSALTQWILPLTL